MLEDSRIVSKLTGKGLARQAFEILKLRARNPGLGASDYYAYGLYDSKHIEGSRLEDFVGWREAGEIPLVLNARDSVLPGWDKFTFALYAHAFGLPTPRMIAFYCEGSRPGTDLAETTFCSAKDLAAWLRTQQHWPLFLKPSFGARGLHCHGLQEYDAKSDALLLHGGEAIAVDDFITNVIGDTKRSVYYRHEMGFLFQEMLRPHPLISEIAGNDSISGMRVVVILDEMGPEVVYAEWKIVTGDNVVDNQASWTTGNLMADIDWDSGRVKRAVEGDWPRVRIFSKHPDTGRELAGFVVPHWREAIDLAVRASAIFPLIRMQHWDIAITDRGPYLLEVNDMGSIVGSQPWGRGILTPRLRALLKRHGDPQNHRIVRRISRERS